MSTLDYILLKFNPLFRRSLTVLSDDSNATWEEVEKLKEDVQVVGRDFIEWKTKQAEEWLPSTIGSISEEQARASRLANCWPGNVDTYFDRT